MFNLENFNGQRVVDLQQIVIVFVFVELISFGIAVRKKNITKYIYSICIRAF